MINFIKRNVVTIVLIILTSYFILPYMGKDFRISFGEGPHMLNSSYLNYSYLWQNKINLGNTLSLQTIFVLFFVIWKFLSLFSFIIQPSLSYVMIGGYFLSGYFFYYTLRALFPVDDQTIYLPPVLLYVFNMYRVIAGNSNENIMLFIALPLYFLFYYKLLNQLRWRYVCFLLILSVLTSSLGINLAIFTLPYILMFSYLVFFCLTIVDRTKIKRLLIMNLTLAMLLILSILFWIIPQYYLLNSYYQTTDSGKTIWAVIGSGTFFDHFRFMGFWAFRDDFYFAYTKLYYQPLFLLTTYSVSIFSFFYLFFIKEKKSIYLKLFIALSTIIFYLLVSGNKGAIGFFYQLLYDHISLFKMYRDSWAKFTPLFIFTMSFGLLFSIYYFFHYLKNRFLQVSFIIFLSIIILINAWPIFKIYYDPKPTRPRWISNIVQIPQYWKDLNQYLNNKKLKEWLLVFQNNGYGTNSNWEYGVNVVGNIAEFILNKPVIRSLDIDSSDTQGVISNIFKNKNSIKNLKAYLGLINSRYLLQENDTEWRYVDLFPPPSQSNKIIREKGFTKVAEFGKFTPSYLRNIPNNDLNPKIRKQLYDELTNQPGLILYKMEDKYFVPLFYTPKKVFISPKQINDLDTIVSQQDYIIPSVIFLTRQNATRFAHSYFDLVLNKKINLSDQPIIEFKEINPVKYRLIIHQAKNSFPLVFSANFSSDWKFYFKQKNSILTNEANKQYLNNYQIINENENDQADKKQVGHFIDNGWISTLEEKPKFISKNYQNTIQNDNLPDGELFETWLEQPIDEKFHLTANGYANTWIVDPISLCSNNLCKKNTDGSYDFEIVLEYRLQKFFLISLVICACIFIISVLYVIIDYGTKI